MHPGPRSRASSRRERVSNAGCANSLARPCVSARRLSRSECSRAGCRAAIKNVDGLGGDRGNAVLGRVASLLAERLAAVGWAARSGDHQFFRVIAGHPSAGPPGEAARLIEAIGRSQEVGGGRWR